MEDGGEEGRGPVEGGGEEGRGQVEGGGGRSSLFLCEVTAGPGRLVGLAVGLGGDGAAPSGRPPCAPEPPSSTVPVLVEIEHEACDDEGDERHQDGGRHRAAVGSKVAADGFGV